MINLYQVGGDPGRGVQHPDRFGVLDTRNRIVWTIGDFLYRITEPVLRPIRNMLPNLGGIDHQPDGSWSCCIQIAVLPLLFKLHAAITYGAWQPLVL